VLATTDLRAKRLQLGLTLRELADQCAAQGAPIHFSSLGLIERGKTVPRPRVRAVLAGILGIDVTDFDRQAG
jgi:transcriptional regulator with XRE-family HTH domain